MAIDTVKDVEYYDNLYSNMIANPDAEGWTWIEERAEKVAPLIEGESVLDLGCGLSLLADKVDIAYRGVDCSSVAVEWKKARYHNRLIIFGLGDLMPGKKHYHPRWTARELDALLHGGTRPRLFGGPDGERWWIVEKERISEIERIICQSF